jgi:hypothetical protein
MFAEPACPIGYLRELHWMFYRGSRDFIFLSHGRGFFCCLRAVKSLAAYIYLKSQMRRRCRVAGVLGEDYTLCGNTPVGGGLLTMLFLLFRLFFIWLFSALESSGLSSSKLHRSSVDTLMTAP